MANVLFAFVLGQAYAKHACWKPCQVGCVADRVAMWRDSMHEAQHLSLICLDILAWRWASTSSTTTPPETRDSVDTRHMFRPGAKAKKTKKPWSRVLIFAKAKKRRIEKRSKTRAKTVSSNFELSFSRGRAKFYGCQKRFPSSNFHSRTVKASFFKCKIESFSAIFSTIVSFCQHLGKFFGRKMILANQPDCRTRGFSIPLPFFLFTTTSFGAIIAQTVLPNMNRTNGERKENGIFRWKIVKNHCLPGFDGSE